MSGFGERFGYRTPNVEIADEDTPETLVAGLWDATSMSFFGNLAEYDIIGNQQRYSTEFKYVSDALWFHFFKKPIDTREQLATYALRQIRDFFFKSDFVSMYEFVEFMANLDVSHYHRLSGGTAYADFCNLVLEREKSPFRFAETTLVRVSDPEELKEIRFAIEDSPSRAVMSHIKRAAELYSQRPNPDYRNSIKESISAVEAAVRFVVGKKTSGVSRPLKGVAEAFRLHPALRDGFEKLYAFTSDEDGVRHALLDEDRITQPDARYMLVSCSAFANYLVSLKAEQQG